MDKLMCLNFVVFVGSKAAVELANGDDSDCELD